MDTQLLQVIIEFITLKVTHIIHGMCCDHWSVIENSKELFLNNLTSMCTFYYYLFFFNRCVTKARKSLIIKLHRTLLLRSLEMNPVAFKTSTVVGVLLDHGSGEALLLRTLLLRSPTVIWFVKPSKIQFCFHWNSSFNSKRLYTAISWGLGTDNSRWGLGLENTVDAESIRNPIHAFSLVQCSISEMVYCHHEKGFFFSSNVPLSSWFRQPINPIMQHNMLQ